MDMSSYNASMLRLPTAMGGGAGFNGQDPNASSAIGVSAAEIEILYKTLESLYNDRIFPEEKTVKARLQVYGATGSLLQNFVNYYRLLAEYNVTTNV